MGNCLKSPTSDDISLLHESQSDRASFGEGTEPDQEPPPPYQVGEGVCGEGGAGGRGGAGAGEGASGLAVPLTSAGPGLAWGGVDALRAVSEGDGSLLPGMGGSFASSQARRGAGPPSWSCGIRACDPGPGASGRGFACGVGSDISLPLRPNRDFLVAPPAGLWGREGWLPPTRLCVPVCSSSPASRPLPCRGSLGLVGVRFSHLGGDL